MRLETCKGTYGNIQSIQAVQNRLYMGFPKQSVSHDFPLHAYPQASVNLS